MKGKPSTATCLAIIPSQAASKCDSYVPRNMATPSPLGLSLMALGTGWVFSTFTLRSQRKIRNAIS